MSEKWELTEHACRVCMGRVLLRKDASGKRVAHCPECGSEIVVRKTKKGKTFYGCKSYPECNFMSWSKPTDEKCPECGKELIVKNGRFGEFIACSGYPECKYTRKIVRTTGIKCPKCGEVFQVDETGYAAIVKQVRDEEFHREIHERLEQFEKEKSASVELAKTATAKAYDVALAKKAMEINDLKSQLNMQKM